MCCRLGKWTLHGSASAWTPLKILETLTFNPNFGIGKGLMSYHEDYYV